MPVTRMVAGAFGAAYAVLGVAGFFATGMAGKGTLVVLTLSPADNLAHLALGAAGLAAYAASPALCRTFCQVAGALLAIVGIAGVIVSDPLGVLPIGGFDVVLHFAGALVLMYLGFAAQGEPAAA